MFSLAAELDLMARAFQADNHYLDTFVYDVMKPEVVGLD
jgi:hypothetical protein